MLTDRDPAFCVGATSDGRAILAPEWVDLCGALGVVPKACRPYRAQTKGKVERLVREVKEGFLPWLSGQAVPARPLLADYDALARRWVEEVVLPAPAPHHRPRRRRGLGGGAPAPGPAAPALLGGAAASRPRRPRRPRRRGRSSGGCSALGAQVEARDLAEYEAVLTPAGVP